MTRRVCIALAVVAALLLPTAASAHPLGNFTVNRYARIEPSAEQVRVQYILDMAEIPTFQEKPRIDADPAGYAASRAAEILANLRLTVNGAVAPLRVEQPSLSFPPGAGGLPTLRLEVTYAADLQPGDPGAEVSLAFADANDPTRIGWREIVAAPGGDGTRLLSSSVPATDTTDELRQYPADLLNSPPDVREARVTFVTGPLGRTTGAPAAVSSNASATVFDRARSGFADLANASTDLTPAFLVFAIAAAIVLGMAHALQPGHGKTVVAAYLVGSRGTPRDALVLGATVTATHTAGVYALGLVTLALSQYIVPERLYPILTVASGGLVLVVGALLLVQRALRALPRRHRGHPHDHDHPHAHDHEHPHAHDHDHDHAPGTHAHHGGAAHSHALPERVTLKSLLALGISGGLLPCPEALVVLLITIAAHRVLFGLLLIVSFSTGLAAVLVGFGLLLVYARGLFGRINLSGGLAPRVLPVLSALVIVIAGGLITVQALPQVL